MWTSALGMFSVASFCRLRSRSISGQLRNRLCPAKSAATGPLDPRLSIICLRSRSLINLKLFNLRRSDIAELQPLVDEHFNKVRSKCCSFWLGSLFTTISNSEKRKISISES